MPRPQSHVLLVVADATLRRNLLKGLNAAAKSLPNPCGLSFSGVESADEALQIAQRIPGAKIGTVEIRPVIEIPGLPGDPASRKSESAAMSSSAD